DGAVKASVPAHLVRDLGVDVVVAVDLGYAGQRDEAVDNIVEVISQSLNILGEELTKCQLNLDADLVIRPRIYDVSLRDFHRIPEIIDRGE
ncbi:MAG TPA: patatin, partial [Firmicutes bacterium]|nr:patatin [Bacillota bacterium]